VEKTIFAKILASISFCVAARCCPCQQVSLQSPIRGIDVTYSVSRCKPLTEPTSAYSVSITIANKTNKAMTGFSASPTCSVLLPSTSTGSDFTFSCPSFLTSEQDENPQTISSACSDLSDRAEQVCPLLTIAIVMPGRSNSLSACLNVPPIEFTPTTNWSVIQIGVEVSFRLGGTRVKYGLPLRFSIAQIKKSTSLNLSDPESIKCFCECLNRIASEFLERGNKYAAADTIELIEEHCRSIARLPAYFDLALRGRMYQLLWKHNEAHRLFDSYLKSTNNVDYRHSVLEWTSELTRLDNKSWLGGRRPDSQELDDGISFRNSLGIEMRYCTGRDFWISATEIPQSAWTSVMGGNPVEFASEGLYSSGHFNAYFEPRSPNKPVVNVTENDCIEFCSRLSRIEGRGYRLPRFDEWCFASAFTDISRHNSEFFLNAVISGDRRLVCASDCGSRRPNKFGIFDMFGNVWEYCDVEADAAIYNNRLTSLLFVNGLRLDRCLVLGGCYDSSIDDFRTVPIDYVNCQTSALSTRIGFRIVLPGNK